MSEGVQDSTPSFPRLTPEVSCRQQALWQKRIQGGRLQPCLPVFPQPTPEFGRSRCAGGREFQSFVSQPAHAFMAPVDQVEIPRGPDEIGVGS